MNITNII